MNARIVVIDNDEGIRQLLTACLEKDGWQVFTYDYAHFDLVALQQHAPDLIILDFDFGDGGTGWELLQLLKMDDATAKIPILITITAFQLSAEIKSYLLTRYISVIPKPFELSTLSALVHETLTLASQSNVLFSSEHTLPILVVEDKEVLLDAVTTILELEGYPFVSAVNGLEALHSVSRADHCLILLDIEMPVMNGYEFLQAYDRQLRPHSPVIILSGETNIRSHFLPAFVVDVLPKPYVISQLLSVVEKFAQPV